MKIQNKDVSINVSGLTGKQGEISGKGKSTRKSFFAGDANLAKDPIEEKRKTAQKKALKIVGDTFAREKKVDDDLHERGDRIKQLEAENKDAQKELQKIEEDKKNLKETYGITDDSEEQKDLELLEKRRDSRNLGSNITLTDEERERLKTIDEAGMTEYQERSLEMDKNGTMYQDTIDKNQKSIIEENGVIRGTKQERLKSSPMVAATQAADQIQAAASEEIKGMLLQDAKDHVDEVQEENQKKAEEKAEKEAEQEKKIAEAKKEKLELEEQIAKAQEKNGDVSQTQETEPTGASTSKSEDGLTKQVVESSSEAKNIQKELEEIMNQMKLLEEDLKGSTVDQNI
ncbi:MAG: hypothetical protein PHE02_13315 [Lachnospiraceae bacterium]|nr:hypothetical protein [Lachnospiraceae bacterium]